MRRSIEWTLATIFILSVWLTFYLFIYTPVTATKSVVTENFRTPLNTSCLIGEHGTGVLLDTGYILTAAHVVDTNSDDIISDKERFVEIEFFGDIAAIYTGRVAYSTMEYDFAFIEIDLPEHIIGMSVVELSPEIGTAVYTIGAARGEPPMISSGFIGSPNGERYRVSCYVTGGNSGGGLFSHGTDSQVLGLISTVDIIVRRMNITVPVPTQRGFMIVQGQVGIRLELNGIAGYVPVSVIRRELLYKNMSILLDKQDDPGLFDSAVALILAKTVSQCLLVVFCAWYFRKYLFSK